MGVVFVPAKGAANVMEIKHLKMENFFALARFVPIKHAEKITTLIIRPSSSKLCIPSDIGTIKLFGVYLLLSIFPHFQQVHFRSFELVRWNT